MPKRVLVTGGAGFIGHHVVEHILKNTDWEVVVLDRLTYASAGFDRLRDINVFDSKRVQIFTTDFTQSPGKGLRLEVGDVDYILHLGAETHVDHSIINPEPFVRSNIIGTFRMLEWARSMALRRLKWFVYFSTDEVFGPAPEGMEYKEWDRYNSTNPYSATKAAAEELCLAWANTYKLPLFICHTMNAFGERQHPEKFIPSTVRKVLNQEVVTIHSDATRTKSGSRFYIHCRNIAAALLFLLERAEQREKYNIVGEREVSNREMAEEIAGCLGVPLLSAMVDFHSSRPGHDLRYALDGAKMRELGWTVPKNFYASLHTTIAWMIKRENSKWLYEMPVSEDEVVRSGSSFE